MSGGDRTESTIDIPTASSSPARVRPPLERGACVGRYLIVDHLGEGGMGVVYKAFDPELGRTVALKLMQAASDGADLQRDRLLREAQALARLSHPNVIAVHDVGTFEDDVFIAMEFVEGRTLREWLKAKHSQRAVLDVFLAAGHGLVAAHRASLIHRDFKPDNVIVGSDGRVRVLDFGLARDATTDVDAGKTQLSAGGNDADGTVGERPTAKASEPRAPVPTPPIVDDSSSRNSRNRLFSPLTRVGAVMGTPRFMAPEQHRGEPVDERADQFSFCVSLYYALYEGFPFAGETSSDYAANVLRGRVQEPPAGARVPRWLRQVLLRGLALQPEARWPSMEAMLSQLSRDPAGALRRRLYVGGVLLSIAALMVGVVRAQQAERRLCAGAEAKLQGVWDLAKKERMRQAFARSDRPWAAKAFEGASAVLDKYARDWVAMRTSACEATRLRGEQSEELLDLRMDCLEQRRRELRELGDLLAGADNALVQRAVQATESLTPLSDCANFSALKAVVRLPRDPVTRARVDALRERIARGRALQYAMQTKQGLALMKSVSDEANTIGDAPTQAEALSLFGILQWRAGDPAGADATLKQALFAAESGKDDANAASACLYLVRAWVDRQPHSADALFWAQNASAWVTRLGGSAPSLTFGLHVAQGALYWGRGEFAEAKTHDERALEFAERSFGATSAEAAIALTDVALVQWNLGDFDSSVAHARRAVDIFEKTRGSTHPSVGEALSTESMGLIELGRVDEAVRLIQRARAILEPWAPPGDPFIAVIHSNLAEAFELQGRYDEALQLMHATLADQKEGDLVASLTTEIGSVLNRQGKHAEALGWHVKALTMKEKANGGDSRELGDSLLGIGLARLGLGQPEQAMAELERADKLANLLRRVHGRIRVALAQALEASGRGDVGRVRLLMTQARLDLEPAANINGKELAAVDAWLARHRE